MKPMLRLANSFFVLLFLPVFAYCQWGVPDAGFGNNGSAGVDVSGFSDDIVSVIVQDDGQLVMCGSAQYTDPDGGTAVLIPITCRFKANGDVDSAFNLNAYTALTAPTFANSYFTDVVQDNNGKLLFYGSRHSDFFILRMKQDGTIDNAFASNGKVVTDLAGSYDLAHGIILDENKNMICVGQTLVGTVLKPLILRYKASGVLDDSFGASAGYTIYPDIQIFGNFIDVVERPDDHKLVAGGYYLDPNTNLNAFMLVRFTADGIIDSTFGTNGIVRLDFGTSSNQFLTKMAMQDDGKIVVVGKDYVLSSSACIARFNEDGSLDDSFQGAGKQVFAWGNTSSSATGCIVQPDGKIVLSGYASNVSSDENFVVMRLLSDGTPDNTFGSNGIAENNFGIMSAIATCSTIQPDGKLIVGGYDGEDAIIARFSSGLYIGIHSVTSDDFSIRLFPNPVTSNATLSCTVEQASPAQIFVCNAMGQELATLYNGYLQKGKQNLALAIPESLGNGTYYFRIKTVSAEGLVPVEIMR